MKEATKEIRTAARRIFSNVSEAGNYPQLRWIHQDQLRGGPCLRIHLLKVPGPTKEQLYLFRLEVGASSKKHNLIADIGHNQNSRGESNSDYYVLAVWLSKPKKEKFR